MSTSKAIHPSSAKTVLSSTSTVNNPCAGANNSHHLKPPATTPDTPKPQQHEGKISGPQTSPLLGQKLRDLLQSIDPSYELSNEAEEQMLHLADDFIKKLLNSGLKVAKHRGSKEVEVKDLKLVLGKKWGMGAMICAAVGGGGGGVGFGGNLERVRGVGRVVGTGGAQVAGEGGRRIKRDRSALGFDAVMGINSGAGLGATNNTAQQNNLMHKKSRVGITNAGVGVSSAGAGAK